MALSRLQKICTCKKGLERLQLALHWKRKNYWNNACLNEKTYLPVYVENLTCCLVFHALHTTREKSVTLQTGIYDDRPRDLVAWIKVVRCPGLVNLLGFLMMRNKNIIFFLCGYGQSARMSGFPALLLLPASQWHFIVMMFCKYSHFGLSIFQKVRGSWQISKWGNAVHTFIHSAGHSLNLTLHFSRVTHGAEKGRNSRAQRWL